MPESETKQPKPVGEIDGVKEHLSDEERGADEGAIETSGNAVGKAIVAPPPSPPGREVLMPMDPERVVSGMKAYQELLPKLLDDSDYQRDGSRRFVKKSGWRKIARAFNLSVSIVPGSLVVERDGSGMAIRAECVARAQAPNGQIQDGDGYCSIEEKRFKQLRENREGGSDKIKVENDLRATATTRAKNRAISDLVGMGEVSAEEADGAAAAKGPPNGPVATSEENEGASTAILHFCNDDRGGAEKLYNEIVKASGGYMPQAVARALALAAP